MVRQFQLIGLLIAGVGIGEPLVIVWLGAHVSRFQPLGPFLVGATSIASLRFWYRRHDPDIFPHTR